MTKEELEKEAEKHADGIYHYKINVSDYGEDGIVNYRYSDVKEAYQKGAEPREKRIAELEAQIEKMKCCGNCIHCKYDENEESYEFCEKHQQVVNVAIVPCSEWKRR